MSEQVKHKEAQSGNEKLVSQEHEAEVHKKKHEQSQHAKNEAAKHDVEALRRSVAEHAPDGKLLAAEKPDKDTGAAFGSHHLLKKESYQQSLNAIRRQLPKPARSFSKLVHNPTIETVSNVSAQTIARPSGLLGGGLGAFLGSAFLLYMSKHYGFEYNYTLFIVLFAGGFLLGLVLELLVWVVWRRRQPTT